MQQPEGFIKRERTTHLQTKEKSLWYLVVGTLL